MNTEFASRLQKCTHCLATPGLEPVKNARLNGQQIVIENNISCSKCEGLKEIDVYKVAKFSLFRLKYLMILATAILGSVSVFIYNSFADIFGTGYIFNAVLDSLISFALMTLVIFYVYRSESADLRRVIQAVENQEKADVITLAEEEISISHLEIPKEDFRHQEVHESEEGYLEAYQKSGFLDSLFGK